MKSSRSFVRLHIDTPVDDTGDLFFYPLIFEPCRISPVSSVWKVLIFPEISYTRIRNTRWIIICNVSSLKIRNRNEIVVIHAHEISLCFLI